MPASATAIVPAPTNNCGTSLAAGASCNIEVSITPLQHGTFNRVLQVGIDSRQAQISAPAITTVVACGTVGPPVPSGVSPSFPCALGSTSTFATLAGTTITNTATPTLLNGDLGLSPGTSVTGFPPGIVNGTKHITDGAAATAQVDLTALYTCLAAQPCGTTIGSANQAGVTLTSTGVGAVNVYCSPSSTINITGPGTLTLSGDPTSVFIFQAGSALNVIGPSTILLTGGLTAANVFWQVTSTATLAGLDVFNGTIVALTSIDLTGGSGSTIAGRALARNL